MNSPGCEPGGLMITNIPTLKGVEWRVVASFMFSPLRGWEALPLSPSTTHTIHSKGAVVLAFGKETLLASPATRNRRFIAPETSQCARALPPSAG